MEALTYSALVISHTCIGKEGKRSISGKIQFNYKLQRIATHFLCETPHLVIQLQINTSIGYTMW